MKDFKFLLDVLEVHCRYCLVGLFMNSWFETGCLEFYFEFISVYLGWVIESKENMSKEID